MNAIAGALIVQALAEYGAATSGPGVGSILRTVDTVGDWTMESVRGVHAMALDHPGLTVAIAAGVALAAVVRSVHAR